MVQQVFTPLIPTSDRATSEMQQSGQDQVAIMNNLTLSQGDTATPNENMEKYFTMAPLLAAGSFLNTIATGVHLVDDSSYEDALKKYTPNAFDFYKRHQAGISLAGDAVGAFIPGTLAVKAISTASRAGKLMSEIPMLGRLMVDTQRFTKMQKLINIEAVNTAAQGVGGEALMASSGYKKLNRAIQTAGVVNGTKNAVASELAIYGTMHSSENLFPSEWEWYDYAPYVGSGIFLSAGLEFAAARKVANDAARRSASFHHLALNPSDAPIKDIIVRPGTEDTAITMRMFNTKDLESVALESDLPKTDPTYYSNINRAVQENWAYIFGNTSTTINPISGVKSTGTGYVDKIARRAEGEVAPSFSLSTSQKANIRLALENEGTSLLGVKEMAPYEPTAMARTNTDQVRLDHVANLRMKSDQLLKRANSGKVSKKEKEVLTGEAVDMVEAAKNWETNMQAFVLRNGALDPIENNVVLFSDTPANKKLFTTKSEGGVNTVEIFGHKDPLSGNTISAAVDYQLNFFGKKGQKLGDLTTHTVYENSAVFSLFDRTLQGMRASRDDVKFSMGKIPIAKNENWMRMDAVLEGLQRKVFKEGDLAFPTAGMSVDDIQLKVLDAKYKLFKQFQERNQALLAGPVKGLGKAAQVNDVQLRYMLNLPPMELGEISPLEELFHGLIAQGDKDLSSWTLAGLKTELNKTRRFADDMEFMTASTAELDAEGYNSMLRGNSFNPAKTAGEQGQWLEPVMVWRMNMTPQKFTRNALEQDLMQRRNMVTGQLTGDYFDTVSGALTPAAQSHVARFSAKLMNSDVYKTAMDVEQVNQASIRGSGRWTTQRFIARDDPTLQAINDVNAMADKETVAYINELFSAPNTMGKTHIASWNTLRSSANAPDAFMFGEFVRARQEGWFMLKKPVKVEGGWSYPLDHTVSFNNKKFRQLFGRDIQKGDMLPRVATDGKYQPLKVSDAAHSGVTSFAEVGQKVLAEQNRIRAAQGLDPMRMKEFWMPPRVYGDNVSYVVSKTEYGSIKRIISGETKSDLESKKTSQEVIDYLNSSDGVLIDQDEMVRYLGQPGFLQARDRAYFEMLDAGDPLVKGTKGALGSVDPNVQSGLPALDSAVESLNNQMQNITRDTLGLMFESQIAYAGRMAHIDTVSAGKRNVWQYYVDNVLGNRALRTDSFVGPVWNTIENQVDRALEYYWDATKGKGVFGAAAEKAQTAVGITPHEKQYKGLKAVLGEWLPYKTAEEFAASTYNIRPPAKAKELAAELNWITSTITLRLMDVAHPLLNITGNIATMPAVINAMKKRAGETEAEWRGRVGMFGSVLPNKDKTPIFNSARLMTNATHYGFTKEGRADLAYATKQGYLKQQVAEINETINAPLKGEGGLKEFVHNYGDKLGWLADRSEEWARGWAHMAGVLVAKQHGLTDDIAKHTFANRFANEVIGDYRAVNRPVVFQGAAGMPLGLFQTYMWNYYQRLYSYVEAKDVRSAVTQFAMQASVFGGVTMPGFQLFNSMWSEAHHGTGSPVDAIQEKFGSNLADVLLYGTISNIPKIFGMDGIALYTRGDASPRIPAFLNPSQAPIYNMASNVFNILGGIADQVRSGGQGLSAQQTAEIMGTYLSNRTFARVFELAAGVSTDKMGNLINEDTRTATSVLSRLMGLRTLDESKMMDVMQRQKVTELSQYAMRTRLRNSLKAAVRGDDISPEIIKNSIMDYAAAGGNPQYFPRFMKTLLMQAHSDKGRLKLIKLLKSEGKIDQALRLMNAGVRFDPEVDGQPPPVDPTMK